MSDFIAALPMYDWPETRGRVDAQWETIRAVLRAQGLDAPEHLTRRNADMPAVPGGIRDAAGIVIAPDPATLPPDALDLPTLWRHPRLLFGQTCWGPMQTTGLSDQVRVIGQPDYSDVEGGQGALYSSAILVRRDGVVADVAAPGDGSASIPLDRLRGKRLAFNSDDSMSGIIALSRDLEALGEGISIVAERIETGGHRASIRHVAGGLADVCAVDCRSWAMAQSHEPAAQELRVVGWTGRRPGLPYISALSVPAFRFPD
jgi:ABC-type phosphate/phosphonate transport system substrate-binding protein